MRVIFACSLLFLVPAALLAEVGFIHENGFSFPAFPPSASKAKFVDLNSDMNLEFFAFDDTSVFVYSYLLDSLVFSRISDSTGVIRSVLVADVNDDGNEDIFILQADHYSVDPWDSSYWKLVCFDGGSAYAESSVVVFETHFCGWAYCESYGLIDAIDVDGDQRIELLFSFSDITDVWWGPGFDESIGGRTIIYDRFPDSVRWDTPVLLTQTMPVSPALVFCRAYSLYYTELGPDVTSSYGLLHRLNQDGTLSRVTDGCKFDDTLCYDPSYISCSHYLARTGDIETSLPGNEILTTDYSALACRSIAAGSSSSGSQIRLYRLDESDSLVEVWAVPFSQSNPYQNFMVHPNLPGYFFGFAGDTLFMFRGENGSIRSSIAAPAGQRYWETNWPDSIPRLVVINGHEVDIYSLDISTDSENDVDPVLPHSFTLGRPYPNPFNAVVAIPVDLSARAHLRVEVFNLLGQPVEVIADREQPAGKAKFEWDASGNPSGVYLIRASAGVNVMTAKLLLLK
jgi:hypothetical protein